jgi:hypothetical protein
MPGVTPIYGFPYPEPSDLVANYPALGQDLAEDIEAVLPTLGGLTKITDVSFSAAATVSVNNCFSATYKNYRMISDIDPTNNVAIEMRLRAGGTDLNSANYNWARPGWLYSNSSSGAGAASQTLWQFNTTSVSTLRAVSSLDFHNPFEASSTGFTSIFASETVTGAYAGMFYNATSADGFTIIVSGGTITGTLRVYGYKD